MPTLRFGLGCFALGAAAILAAPKAAAANCPYEGAHYVLKAYPEVTADFVRHDPAPGLYGTLFLRVRVGQGGQTYWYSPEIGNGYSTIRLISIDDPGKRGWHAPDPDSRKGRPSEDETYYGLNADLSFRAELPAPGAGAPDLILIPELAPAIWYDPRTDLSRKRLTRAFFVFDHCQR